MKDLIIHPNKYRVYINKSDVSCTIVKGELNVHKNSGVLIFLPYNKRFSPEFGNLSECSFVFDNIKEAKIFAESRVRDIVSDLRTDIEIETKELSNMKERIFKFLQILNTQFKVLIVYNEKTHKFE